MYLLKSIVQLPSCSQNELAHLNPADKLYEMFKKVLPYIPSPHPLEEESFWNKNQDKCVYIQKWLCLGSDNYVMSSWAPLQLYGLREAEKGDSCVRKRDFRNRKERVTNLGEGSNFSGLGWGKPSRRTSFSVTFYNPIILSKSSIS